jgi:hypothetical protein
MSGKDSGDSVIQDILHDTMTRSRGLDYAVYAVTDASDPDLAAAEGPPKLLILNRSRGEQLSYRLERFAFLGRTADHQVDLWEGILHRIHSALRSLDPEFVTTGQGANVRVVFDVDMGGFFYTRLGSQAVLFGATLDQAEVNNGRCEREMYHLTSQIEAVFTAHGA